MEVVTALSVISFALVALLGVFPIGLENSRASVNETRAAQIVQTVFATLRAEPFGRVRCFGHDQLDLAVLDNLEDGDPKVLWVSYVVEEQPQILREDSAPADAIYRIELRFQPEPFKAATTTPPAGGTPRIMASTVHFLMTSVNTPKTPVLEVSTTISNHQRVPFAK